MRGGRAGWAVVAAAVVAATGCGTDSHRSGPTTTVARRVEPVRVGLLVADSGPAARVDLSVQHGVELAVSQYLGSSPAVPVALDVIDTHGQADQAAAGARRMVDAGDVAVVVSGSSGETSAALAVLDPAGVSVLGPTATDPLLADQGWTVFHRLVVDDRTQGAQDADYLQHSIGVQTVAVVSDTTEAAGDLIDGLEAELIANGATVSGEPPVAAGSLPPPAMIDRLAAADPDAVYVAGSAALATDLMTQLRAAGYQGPVLAAGPPETVADLYASVTAKAAPTTGETTTTAGTSTTSTTAGDATTTAAPGPAGSSSGATGATTSTTAGGSPPQDLLSCACADPSTSTPFEDTFQAAYGVMAPPFAAESYDAVGAVLDAIRAGDSSRSTIAAYLGQRRFDGAAKSFRFTTTGELQAGQSYIWQVGNTSMAQVAAEG